MKQFDERWQESDYCLEVQIKAEQNRKNSTKKFQMRCKREKKYFAILFNFFKMNLPKYTYKTNSTFLDYEFESIGPKGKVKKIVRFTEIKKAVYNLAFGDLDELTGEISDTIVTNNNDSKKVLSTVAAIVYDFTKQYPESWVVAKGSTHARTRLYRMGIANHFNEITDLFDVYGLTDINWVHFELRKDYDAFLIQRK